MEDDKNDIGGPREGIREEGCRRFKRREKKGREVEKGVLVIVMLADDKGNMGRTRGRNNGARRQI